MMKNSVILVDVDGVLLNWSSMFEQWMLEQGYTKYHEYYSVRRAYNLDPAEANRLVAQFNTSARMRSLPPFRDAVSYVKRLHEEHGFVFHAITSMSDDWYAQRLRTENLVDLFGKQVFQRIVYLPIGAKKDNVLAEYKDTGCIWVEDKVDNAYAGTKQGLDSILMKHDFHADLGHKFKMVNNWKDIYNYVVDYGYSDV